MSVIFFQQEGFDPNSEQPSFKAAYPAVVALYTTVRPERDNWSTIYHLPSYFN